MKILFLSPWFPYPPVNGLKIRIYNLIKSLSSRHSIELISFVRYVEAYTIVADVPDWPIRKRRENLNHILDYRKFLS